MLRLLARVLRGLPGYLWSGWGAGASLFLLLAAWEAVDESCCAPVCAPVTACWWKIRAIS